MIYFGVFVASDPAVDDDDREDYIHLLVEAASLSEADAAFKEKLRQLWDRGDLDPRFTQIHPVRLVEMPLAPRAAACVYFTVASPETTGPIEKVVGEPGATLYMAEEDEGIPAYLDRRKDLPPVKWQRE